MRGDASSLDVTRGRASPGPASASDGVEMLGHQATASASGACRSVPGANHAF